MLKPDEKTLKALNNIQQYPDWKIIREWIDEGIKHALLLGSTIPTEPMRTWKQGAAQELIDISDYFDNARKVLDRMDKAKEQTPGIV